MSAALKGWCPGALRPMESGDGLIVRLRVSCGEVPLALARAVAGWAEAFGDGSVELSARANWQIRGLGEAALPALRARVAEAGLLDAAPDAEAVRNVLVSPFAGLDPAATCDVRPFARAWERELAASPDLWRLPGKFGAGFDAGAFPLGVEADLNFAAVRPDAFVVRLAGAGALGPFAGDALVDVAARLARGFLALRERAAPPRRMRDAVATHGLDHFAQAAGQPLAGAPAARVRPRADWLGAQALGAAAFAGLALPFGRIEGCALRALAKLAEAEGASELRLTPWRALIVPLPTRAAARRLAEAAPGLGLIAEPADPLLAVAACPGAPSCASAQGETRALARRLAPRLKAREGVALHVSGCAKGCAHPAPAPLTVIAADGGYDVVRSGRADGEPVARGLDETALAPLLNEFA